MMKPFVGNRMRQPKLIGKFILLFLLLFVAFLISLNSD